ncbi:MAG: hypothetical protein GC149_10505 [Gammaproteobacteria bacterium]|nr:hypothetical protein [Gammaproteobacteria bacterium]
MAAANKNYVCLSDLHLGAKYSVLSARDEAGQYLAATPSDCLNALAASLRQYLPRVFETPPVLVLMGDCLDFDFGTLPDIAEAFRSLISAFFPAKQTPVFDASEIIVIPGNHDHRLWQYEKDRLFIRHYPQIAHYQTTRLFTTEGIDSYFLNSLVAQHAAGAAPHINLYYPNYGLESADGQRQVILHHGHFIEGLYRLISRLQEFLNTQFLPHRDIPPEPILEVERLERDNAGWIDFLWSGLGMTNAGAANASWLYDIMQDPAASQQYLRKFADLLCDYLSRHYGVNPRAGIKQLGNLSVNSLVTSLLDAGFGKAFQGERMSYHDILSAKGISGLRWYLQGPVLEQIKCERLLGNGNELKHTSFVFGHTHKPFQQRLPVDGFDKPPSVFNTGGWVVDEPGLTVQQGAAAVFIDSECRVASLRLFQDPVNAEITPVSVQGVDDADPGAVLRQRMQQALDAAHWETFSQAVATAIQQRAQATYRKFFDPNSNTGMP